MYINSIKIAAIKKYDNLLKLLFNIRIFLVTFDNKNISCDDLEYHHFSKDLNKYSKIVLIATAHPKTIIKFYRTFEKFKKELFFIYLLHNSRF